MATQLTTPNGAPAKIVGVATARKLAKARGERLPDAGFKLAVNIGGQVHWLERYEVAAPKTRYPRAIDGATRIVWGTSAAGAQWFFDEAGRVMFGERPTAF